MIGKKLALRFSNFVCLDVAIWVAGLMLAGCATHVPPAPVVETSQLTGSFQTGVVVAVRSSDPARDPGVINRIISALNEPPPGSLGPPRAELVILRSGNAVTSIVEAPKPGEPAFVPGEKIAIIEAGATVIRPE